MELSELFTKLSYGPLSNLAISNNGSGEIIEDAKPKLTSYANTALLRLYSRFVLKENDVLVKMLPGVTFYHLLPQYAEQSYDPESEITPYILDLSREKFEGDVVKILSIYDDMGCKRPLNDDNAWNSLYTPQHNTVQNPSAKLNEVLAIHYQAKHAKLVWDATADQTIYLPDVLEEALTSYIAYKVYTDMNTPDSTAKAQEHMGMYDNICNEVVDRDLVNSSVAGTNIKFAKRGFC
jgi:hypothetical protein